MSGHTEGDNIKNMVHIPVCWGQCSSVVYRYPKTPLHPSQLEPGVTPAKTTNKEPLVCHTSEPL